MKVYKFFVKELFYIVSGKTIKEATDCLFDIVGICLIDKHEVIDESQWDEKTIDFYDEEADEYFKLSIRETIESHPSILASNDKTLID